MKTIVGKWLKFAHEAEEMSRIIQPGSDTMKTNVFCHFIGIGKKNYT